MRLEFADISARSVRDPGSLRHLPITAALGDATVAGRRGPGAPTLTASRDGTETAPVRCLSRSWLGSGNDAPTHRRAAGPPRADTAHRSMHPSRVARAGGRSPGSPISPAGARAWEG